MDQHDLPQNLYRGTAADYDRFRVPYPQPLIDDLIGRAKVGSNDRLLDLACGTGQISFAMHRSFGEIWAVDQEPDMIGFGREKAKKAGVRNIKFVTSSAEDLVAPDESFDLVAIGNAFHRLRRDTVTLSTRRWLRPGRCLALLWAEPPWRGDAPWQKAMSAVLDRWMTTVAAHTRIPPRWEQGRRERPDRTILQESGLQLVGHYQFPTAHQWTNDALVGLVYSTSFLSRKALADNSARFEQDLRREISSSEPTGRFSETIDFAYELACRPA